MNKTPKTARVSKDQWLAKALEIFSVAGEEGLRVEAIAKVLGVAKSGFYWHFKNRDDLLEEICKYWIHEYTEVLSSNVEIIALPPKERLFTLMNMVFDHDLAEFDISFRAWAANDPGIARKVKKVISIRTNIVRQAFNELGFSGEELEMRTQLFVGYESNERSMFNTTKKKSAQYRLLRLQLLTS